MKRIEEMNLWERVVTVQLACNKDPDSALLHPGYEECWKGLFTTKHTKVHEGRIYGLLASCSSCPSW